jgi:hypothetical protein
MGVVVDAAEEREPNRVSVRRDSGRGTRDGTWILLGLFESPVPRPASR